MKRLNKILSSQDEITVMNGRNFRARHTFAELDAIYAAHNGRCDICGTAPGNHKFALDHDHATGKLRGLLCLKCNNALGFFKDDINIMRKAIEYLKSRS